MAGLVAVVWAAYSVSKFVPRFARLTAVLFLILYGVILIFQPSSWVVMDLMVLLGAIGGAVLIGSSLSSSRSVAVFLVTAAIVDIISLSSGFSRMIIDRYQAGSSDLLLYLTLVVPIGARLVPIIGISDLLVGGSAATALFRNGLNRIAVIGAIAIGFIAALAYGLWRGGAPGLPFIAITVSLLVWRSSTDAMRHVDVSPDV